MEQSSSLTRFCNQTFSIFDSKLPAFSACFETFVFVLAPFLLLCITSAFYIGRLRPPDVTLRTPGNFNLRRMCTGITLLLTIGALLNDVILFKLSMSSVAIISYSTRMLTLLVHVVFLWRLGMIHFDYKRGPGLVILSWLLTFPFYGVQLENIIAFFLNISSKTSVNVGINKIINLFCISGMVACQLTYFATIIRRNPKYRTVSILSQTSESTQDLLTPVNVNGERYYDVSHNDLPTEEEEGDCPVDSANWISRLFFWWVQPLMRKGAKKLLNREHSVYKLPDDLSTENLCNDFSNQLQNTVLHSNFSANEPDSGKTSRHLLKTLHKKFGKKYYLLGLLKFGADALGFAGPILLNKLVNFVQSNEPIANGCYYAVALFASTLIGSLLMTHFDYQVNKISISIKSSLIGAVFTKTMHAKPVAMSTYTTGEITNFMSTDVNRIVNFCPSFHQFWSLPFQVVITLVLLYQQVGVVFLVGLGFALLMILFNRYLAKKIGEYNKGLMEHKDSRVKLMTEVLLGIRVIKFNVWENYLSEEINSIRSKELKSLSGIKYFDAACVYLWATTPVLISLLIFSVYSATGHVLTAANVFTAIALINMLIAPLNAFPWVINGLMEAWISLDRLEKFMTLSDLDLEEYYDAHVSSIKNEDMLKIERGTFSWNADVGGSNNSNEGESDNSRDLMLRDISLNIKEGQFVGVIGTVGSGKSSLLSAVCAEMEKTKGAISLSNADKGVALVSQEPWLQHATVKDNILWGQLYNAQLYEAVVECCALNEDFLALPNGDLTEVGENGVTLSGGQKARISLARAVYQDKPLYLLDDPLSAVDQHVASHLYRQCIAGILRDRTRILCTHHVKYLQNADIVIEMRDGKIFRFGSPSEILELDLVEEACTSSDSDATSKSSSDEDSPRKVDSLLTTEEKASGTVALKVYKAYWLAIGGGLAFSILLFVVLMQGSKVASDWWLSHWVNVNASKPANYDSQLCRENYSNICRSDVLGTPVVLSDTSYTFLLKIPAGGDVDSSPPEHGTMYYLMIYGIIAAANSIFTLIRAFTFAYGGICAAKVLHKNLLKSILRAPISFFDVTPVGRIINRFSSDMYTIDDSLPFMLNIFLAQIAGLIATIAVTCYGLPYFAILLLPLSVFYYYTQRYYRMTSRELKRLSSISLSPIYAHFTESLIGISTIRAFRRTKSFRERNVELIETNQRCNFSTLAAQEWLAIRLQMMGVVMVTGVAFTAVLEQNFKDKSSVQAGLVGLALSYALSVTGRLSGVITSFTETEKQMVAVERQAYYITNVPRERPAATHELQLREAWPSGGGIEFRQVYLRYRPNLPLAVDNVTFKIEPGEKIGVVGRTGSGKSSLFLTLFGMVPTSGGAILIDGVNINRVPLQTLRSKMAIIPQDPFIFNGPIRSNLDPSGKVGDGQEGDGILWWALESCGLRKVVEKMGGLDTEAGERGRRLSVGQRQLMCLARALLRDVQIVCLDEATANVDRESDVLLQETIHRHFSRRTVITIAHRIETVLESDRVLVMDGGKVAEFGTPKELLSNQNGLFTRLVQRAGHNPSSCTN